MSTHTELSAVKDFVSQKTLAVVGVSRNSKKFGNFAYRELKARGYQVIPVNRNVEQVDGDRCYPTLQSLPTPVDGVVIVVPPTETENVVRDATQAGIKRIWMQQGAESEQAIKLCQERGVSEIHGECILMFTEPVKSYHKFHRGIMRMIGKLPK